MENGVKISIDEYNALNYNNTVLDFLAAALVNAARLDYSGKRLSFDDSAIDTTLKIILPDTYNATLNALQADKELETEG